MTQRNWNHSFSLVLKLLLGLTAWNSRETNFCSASPMELTALNVEEITDGKSVFLMFYDSTCEECEDRREDWAQLATEWEGHEVGVIAQTDCSDEEGFAICDYFQVTEIPSAFYGGSMSFEPYTGRYDFETLSTFAKKHISKPICSAFRPENCQGEDLKILEQLQEMPVEEFDALAETAKAEMMELSEKFDAAKDPLIDQQNALVDAYSNRVDEILAEYHYKFVHEILSLRSALNEAEEEQDIPE